MSVISPNKFNTYSYALGKRYEYHIEDEEQWWADFLLQNFPAVVLRANAVASLAPVVVGQACLTQLA